MRYVESRFRERDRDEAYRIYVTETLRAISGANVRYYDFVSEKKESRTSHEIIGDISAKLSKLGGGE
jgi:hypothetical protein